MVTREFISSCLCILLLQLSLIAIAPIILFILVWGNYGIDIKIWTINAIIGWFLGLGAIMVCLKLKKPNTDEENPAQSTRSRPRLASISYLRTLSLPTYEMAASKKNKKAEETPPPQFDELHFSVVGGQEEEEQQAETNF